MGIPLTERALGGSEVSLVESVWSLKEAELGLIETSEEAILGNLMTDLGGR